MTGATLQYRPYLKSARGRKAAFLAWMTCGPILLFLFGLMFSIGLVQAFLAGLLWVSWLLSLLGFAVSLAIKALSKGEIVLLAPATILIAYAALMVVVFRPVVDLSGDLGRSMVLAVKYRAYEAVIAQVEASKGRMLHSSAATAGDGRLARFWLDKGPPIRVAFPVGSFTKPAAVIYDPSDVVAFATGLTDHPSNSIGARQASGAFGGQLFWCDHLKDHFYWCSFI